MCTTKLPIDRFAEIDKIVNLWYKIDRITIRWITNLLSTFKRKCKRNLSYSECTKNILQQKFVGGFTVHPCLHIDGWRLRSIFHVFTARKQGWGKVMFLHLCVIQFTGVGFWGGGRPPGCRPPLDADPLGLGRPPEVGQTSQGWVDPLDADPPGWADPPGCNPPPQGLDRPPLMQAHLGWAHPHTANKRAVRILLECILVFQQHAFLNVLMIDLSWECLIGICYQLVHSMNIVWSIIWI